MHLKVIVIKDAFFTTNLDKVIVFVLNHYVTLESKLFQNFWQFTGYFKESLTSAMWFKKKTILYFITVQKQILICLTQRTSDLAKPFNTTCFELKF